MQSNLHPDYVMQLNLHPDDVMQSNLHHDYVMQSNLQVVLQCKKYYCTFVECCSENSDDSQLIFFQSSAFLAKNVFFYKNVSKFVHEDVFRLKTVVRRGWTSTPVAQYYPNLYFKNIHKTMLNNRKQLVYCFVFFSHLYKLAYVMFFFISLMFALCYVLPEGYESKITTVPFLSLMVIFCTFTNCAIK
jgi:hypothetical protein